MCVKTSKITSKFYLREQKQELFLSYSKDVLFLVCTVLLPFLTIPVHASGTIKVISWTVTVLKFIKSMQYDCSNRTSAG